MRRLTLFLVIAGSCVSAVAMSGVATGKRRADHRDPRNGLIVFMRPGTIGEFDLWAVRPDGTGLRRLTESPRNRSDYNPDWSPDGSRVLFERRVLQAGNDGDDLYTVQGDGTRLRQLTNCFGHCWADNEATYSADGNRVAFGRATGSRTIDHPSKVAIYVMNSDGTGIRELSTPTGDQEDHYPTWSPDGRTIVFQRNFNRNRRVPTRLIAVDVATGAERTVYRFPSWAPGAGIPKYSPDGKRILFHYWCGIWGDGCPPNARRPRNLRLATIRPNGTGLRRLHLRILGDTGAWAPDGNEIAFRCQPRLGTIRLCTSLIDGKGLKIFPWPLLSVHPDWGAQR